MEKVESDFKKMEIIPIVSVDNCYDCDDGTGGECDTCNCDACGGN